MKEQNATRLSKYSCLCCSHLQFKSISYYYYYYYCYNYYYNYCLAHCVQKDIIVSIYLLHMHAFLRIYVCRCCINMVWVFVVAAELTFFFLLGLFTNS